MRSFGFRFRMRTIRSVSSRDVDDGILKHIPVAQTIEWRTAGHVRRSQVHISLVELLQCLRSLRLKRRLARQTLIHDRADGPQIRFAVVLQRSNHLGRHVHRRAAQRPGHHTVREKPRETEIGDLQDDVLHARIVLVRMREENVLWLQVTVYLHAQMSVVPFERR